MDKNFIVLLVEDDENDALLLQRALKKSGITNPVKWLRDGMEAVQYLEGEGDYFDRKQCLFPKVIILDLKMPRMSGMELLRYLQDHPKVKVIPTIVLSSSRLAQDIEAAYSLGAQTYFVKPTDSEVLVKLLRSCVDYWEMGEKLPK
jgi:CheY-like chemotaxis protein